MSLSVKRHLCQGQSWKLSVTRKTEINPLSYHHLIFLPFFLSPSTSFYKYLSSFLSLAPLSAEMKLPGGKKLVVLHHKAPRLWLLALLSSVAFLSVLSLLIHRHATLPPSTQTSPFLSSFPTRTLPDDLFHVILHYATTEIPSGLKLPETDLKEIAANIFRKSPCNLLIFGLGHETLLYRSLNRGGRTVFIDENGFLISHLEERHVGLIEAYDVKFPKEMEDLGDLLSKAKEERKGDCRPVQNLLFSDCRLAVNDLPNDLYDVPWDVILVDGPRGWGVSAPGRASAIFTAAVMARSGGGRNSTTVVLVHDYNRELERICSEEFLCKENLVKAVGRLAHFEVKRPAPGVIVTDFCRRTRSANLRNKNKLQGRENIKIE